MLSDDLDHLATALWRTWHRGALSTRHIEVAVEALAVHADRARQMEAQAVPVTARASQADGNNVVDLRGYRAARARRQVPGGGGHAA